MEAATLFRGFFRRPFLVIWIRNAQSNSTVGTCSPDLGGSTNKSDPGILVQYLVVVLPFVFLADIAMSEETSRLVLHRGKKGARDSPRHNCIPWTCLTHHRFTRVFLSMLAIQAVFVMNIHRWTREHGHTTRVEHPTVALLQCLEKYHARKAQRCLSQFFCIRRYTEEAPDEILVATIVSMGFEVDEATDALIKTGGRGGTREHSPKK